MPSFIKNFLRRMRKQPSFGVEAGPVFSVREGEVAVATYTSAADKMRVFSAFIREGLEKGDRVEYLYSSEDGGTVRAKLEEHGIDVKKYEKDGTLLMGSITEYYMPDGKFDKNRAVEKGLDLRDEAKSKGYKHVRELIDVGDFSFLNGQWKRYLEYWNDPRWGAPPGVGILYEPFITELTVFNVEGMSKAQVGDILKAFGGGTFAQTKFIDLLEHAEAFSGRINTNHEKLLGHKFLLEFDPTSNYERAVEDFANEALANFEPILVFTSRTSAVHTCLAQQRIIRFFLMSISTSTPESISENEILLPANNTALILDSLSKVLGAYAEDNMFLVFDNLSELIESIGIDRTYRFLHYMLDMLSSASVTALFLFNTSAHEPQVASCLRELLRNQLAYRENQLKVVKSSLS